MTDQQANMKLMKDIGAKHGYNPMPPDQHRWTLGKRRGGLYRLWGWMIDHTLALGKRSAYAVSDGGAELRLEHAAADLEMDLSNVYRYWKKGVILGLWRRGEPHEGKNRLYLCGEVVPTGEEDDEDDPTPTNGLSPRLMQKVKSLPQEQQQRFWTEWNVRMDVRNTALREMMATARDILDRDDDAMLAEFGIVRSRQDRSPDMPPEELAARQSRIEKLHPSLEQHVLTIQAAVVQERKSAQYGTQYNGSQNGASLLTSENYREEETTTTEASPAAPENVVVVVAPSIVLEELNKHGSVTPKAAVKLVSDCRKAFPGATEEEIAAMMAKIAAGFTRATRNPVGVLLSETPAHFQGYERPALARTAPDPHKEAEREREMAHNFLAHPDDVKEDLLQWAREILDVEAGKPEPVGWKPPQS